MDSFDKIISEVKFGGANNIIAKLIVMRANHVLTDITEKELKILDRLYLEFYNKDIVESEEFYEYYKKHI